MRIQLSQSKAQELGRKIRDFGVSYTQPNQEKVFSHNLAQEVEKTFHHQTSQDQRTEFVEPLWKIIGGYSDNAVVNLKSVSTLERVSGETYPIVPAFKDSPDVILKIISKNGKTTIPEINFDKGGLAHNTTEALKLLGILAYTPSLLGNISDPISLLHKHLLDVSGIDTSLSVRTVAGTYLHTCFYVEDNGEPKEFWMAQVREPFEKTEISELTDLIKKCCETNPGEPLVLAAIPPVGTDNRYWTQQLIEEIAEPNNNPVLFNPKQYDYLDNTKTSFLIDLFLQKKLNLIKPNLEEFVQFLKFAYVIKGSEEDEVRQRLYKDVEKGKFKNLTELGKKLVSKLDPDSGVLVISLGKHGAVIINKKYALYSKAPEIGKGGCPSGAGDSGIASIIAEARDLIKGKINFKSKLNDADLNRLLLAFIYAASATASLPGNKIAGPHEINALKQQELKTRLIK